MHVCVCVHVCMYIYIICRNKRSHCDTGRGPKDESEQKSPSIIPDSGYQQVCAVLANYTILLPHLRVATRPHGEEC